MRIGGVDPKSLPTEVMLVLPRGETQVVFRATGISDYDEFNALCPEPTPPGRLTPEGYEPDPNNMDYQSVVAAHNAKRNAWMAITSLKPSNIEWDTVNPAKPSTWKNWREDLKNAGFNQVERSRIMNLVWEANCLDEDKLIAARAVFVAGQEQAQNESSGQNSEPETMQSGEPASG